MQKMDEERAKQHSFARGSAFPLFAFALATAKKKPGLARADAQNAQGLERGEMR